MNLQLSLKTKWFEMTDPNEKTEDYREITPYWFTRLFERPPFYEFDNFIIDINDLSFRAACTESMKQFETNTMTLGYPKKGDTSRIKIFKHAGIEIREGRQEWGAEKGKLYFVIKHGERTL